MNQMLHHEVYQRRKEHIAVNTVGAANIGTASVNTHARERDQLESMLLLFNRTKGKHKKTMMTFITIHQATMTIALREIQIPIFRNPPSERLIDRKSVV